MFIAWWIYSYRYNSVYMCQAYIATMYIYVCVPYNIPDRINQTNVYTNLYVKATQHFELNFIVLYIYTLLSAVCLFQMPQSHILLSKAIWPFHIFKGHLGHARFSKASWPLIFFKCHLGNAILSKAMWPFFSKATWAMHTPSRSPWAQVQLQRAGGAPAGHQGGATHLLHSVCRTRP